MCSQQPVKYPKVEAQQIGHHPRIILSAVTVNTHANAYLHAQVEDVALFHWFTRSIPTCKGGSPLPYHQQDNRNFQIFPSTCCPCLQTKHAHYKGQA